MYEYIVPLYSPFFVNLTKKKQLFRFSSAKPFGRWEEGVSIFIAKVLLKIVISHDKQFKFVFFLLNL